MRPPLARLHERHTMLPRGEFTRVFSLLLGATGLIWGLLILPVSEASDDFGYFENRLLQSETFDSSVLAHKLASPAAQDLEDCDSPAQTALLLAETNLAWSALRAGDVETFEKYANSLDSRSKRALACAPRQSFVWLLAFSSEIMHGRLNERSFNLLSTSYAVSPNEAWIGVRRIAVAIPLIMLMPESLRDSVLDEFQLLVRDGFAQDAARSYLRASGSVRSLLESRLQRVDARRQKQFWEATRHG
jgi:hypothetical protein